jgi:hypothetical protein
VFAVSMLIQENSGKQKIVRINICRSCVAALWTCMRRRDIVKVQCQIRVEVRARWMAHALRVKQLLRMLIEAPPQT